MLLGKEMKTNKVISYVIATGKNTITYLDLFKELRTSLAKIKYKGKYISDRIQLFIWSANSCIEYSIGKNKYIPRWTYNWLIL